MAAGLYKKPILTNFNIHFQKSFSKFRKANLPVKNKMPSAYTHALCFSCKELFSWENHPPVDPTF